MVCFKSDNKIIGVLVLVFVSTSAMDKGEPCRVTPNMQLDSCIISVYCSEIISTNFIKEIKDTTCFKERKNSYKIIFEADKIKQDKTNSIIGLEDELMAKVQSITIKESETAEVLNKILVKMTAAETITLTKNSISEFDLNILTRDSLKNIYASNNEISKLVCPPKSTTYNNVLHSINLSNNNIADIPGSCFKYFGELQSLDLSHNKITKMDVLAFQGLEKLSRLFLQNNNLQQIDDRFLRLGNILELSLANNNINEISSNALKAMTKLEKLNLKGNQLSILEENIFNYLKDIQKLDLSENKLTKIPVLDNNTLLEELYLQNNFISNILKGHFAHNKIKKINLRNNQISGALDQGAFEGLLISEIDLSSNIISQLGPKCFSSMKLTLKKVNLNNNKLNQVSETAFQDLELSELDLSNNELEKIEFQNHDLPNLTILNIAHNNITSLDIEFKNLVELDTSYNKIAHIEFPKFEFKQLQKILLNNNPLNDLLKEIDLVQFEKVTEMDISNTKIKGFGLDAFKNMKKLKKLISHHCEIATIQNAFDGANSLEELDLSYNQLTGEVKFNINTLKRLDLSHNEIEKASVTNSNTLETLSLTNNKLSSIELSSLSDLKNIYLSENPNLPIKANELGNINLLENAILNNISEISFQNAKNVNIKHLELSNCNIKDIELVYLKNIKRLETLVLSHNQIKSIPSNSFKDVSLTALDLSYNDINDVEPNAFESSIGIKDLNLKYNQLQYLHIKSLNGLTDLDSLDVSNNKLDSFEISRVQNLPLKKIYIDNNQLTSMQFSDFSDMDLELMSIGGNDIPCTDIKYALNDNTNINYKITTKEFSSDYSETKGIKCLSNDPNDNITTIKILEYLEKIHDYVSGRVSSKNNEVLLNDIRNTNEVLNKNIKETLPLGSDLKKILDKLNRLKNLLDDNYDHTSIMKILTFLNETISNIKKSDGQDDDDKLKNILHALEVLNENIAELSSSLAKINNETLSQGLILKKIQNVQQHIDDKMIKWDKTISKLNASLNGSVEYLLNFKLLAFTVLFLYYVK